MKRLAYFVMVLTAFVTLRAERIIGEGWYDTSVLSNGVYINTTESVSGGSENIGEPFPIGAPSSKSSSRVMLSGSESENADLVNLVTMLDNDPEKIIDYVRTNIKTEVYYGVKKGALMTLYEKSGNDYDKCVLIKALMEVANTEYVFYFVKSLDLIPIKRLSSNNTIMSLADMFGISADLDVAENKQALLLKLFETRIPFKLENINVNGTLIECVLMPRYKAGLKRMVDGVAQYGRPIEVAGLKKSLNELYDVKNQTGLNSTSLLSAVGGTLGNSQVENLNENGLTSALKNKSATLSSLMANNSSLSSKNLVGNISQLENKISLSYFVNYLLPRDPNTPQPLDSYLFRGFETYYNKTYSECIAMYKAQNGDVGQNVQSTGLVQTYYKEVPNYDYSYLRIYEGNSTTLLCQKKLAELNGERLWVYFDGNTAYLKHGDATLFSKTVNDTEMQITFEIQHGYDSLFDGDTNYASLIASKSRQLETFRKGNTFVYNIAYGYSDASALLSKRQGIYADKFAAAKSVSGNFDSDGKFIVTNGNLNLTQKDLLAEGLNVMGLTWLAQTYKSGQTIANAHACYSQYVHRMGKIAQEEGFYIDVKLQMSGTTSATLNSADEKSAFRLSSFFASAMEHGVIQQLQDGAEAISTANIFHYANLRNNPFIILKNASQVDSLTGYATAEKDNLKAVFTDIGEEDDTPLILIPKNRTCVPDAWSWKGYGYVVFSNSRAGMMISGNLTTQNGGFSAYPRNYSFQSTYTQISTAPSYSSINSNFSTYTTINNYLPTFVTPKRYSEDPVDMFSGAYVYETQDVSAGETLSFNRIYNSNLNENKDSGLGYGWRHNYAIDATPRTAWEESLGNGTAEQASSFVVSVYAAKEVMNSLTSSSSDADIAKAWSTAALIARWGIDEMLENSVSIRIGKEAMQFVKQYKNTGTTTSPIFSEYYAAPAGTNYKLIKNSSNKYELSAPYGETMVFNADNNIESITTLFGRTTTFTYNSDKKLTTVTDPFARTLTLTWSGDKITGVSCMGKSATFSYTGDNLTSCTDVLSKSWVYEYDVNNRMTVFKNPNNGGSIVVRNVYSDNGAVIEQYSEGNDTKKWTLSYVGTRSEEKDPLGNIKKYTYDDRGFCTKITDSNGNSTLYEYDAQGREIMREYPPLFVSSSTSEDGVVTKTFTTSRIRNAYDNWHNKTSEIIVEVPIIQTITPIEGTDSATLTTVYGDESKKSETIYAYETTTDGSVPRLLSVTQKGLLSGETDRVKTITSYFTNGSTKTNLPTSITDERGVVSSYTYDNYGRLLTESVGGRVTTYSNFNSYDQAQKIQHPDLTVDTMTFNDLGDILTTTDAAGLTTTYTYDNKRRVIGTNKTATGMTTPITTSIVYDDADNVISQINEDGLALSSTWTSQKKKLTDTVGTGDAAQTTTYGYDLANNQISTTLPDGKVITNTLDPVGNILTTTVGGQTTTYTYNTRNQVSTVKSHLGNTISYAYDVLGNKTLMTDANGKTVTYAYNSFGEQISLTNRRNGIFQMVNNLSERKSTLTTPMGKISTTNYATGTWDVTSTVSPAGNTTTMTYDATSGRLTSSADTVGTISYSYDEAGRLSGRSQTDADPIAYVYDSMGRVVASTELGGITTQYAYTPSGKLAAILYPGVNEVDAREVNYTYDNLGRLWKITDWANRVTTYTYDNANRITRIDRPNGTYRQLTYDSTTGNLTGIAEKKSDGSVIFSYGYTYDGDNRITQITRTPKQRTFKRDAYTATYDLDNKLQTFGNKTITYDNDGNMTSGPITEGGNNIDLSFNARGQLIGTGDVAYDYDLEGNRTSLMHYDKNKILTQYRYVYNRVGNVPEVLMRVKLTNMTSQSTYYVYGAGLAYEVKITPDGQEAVRYYHYDQVGSTVAMTDSAQSITDRFHYDPWGYVLHSIGDSDTPFQFVGAYGIQTDPNGLINMRARYYNPVTMSFISQDPIGFKGGLNWYLYASGNPFMRVDKNGCFDFSLGITSNYLDNTIVGSYLSSAKYQNNYIGNVNNNYYSSVMTTLSSLSLGYAQGVYSANATYSLMKPIIQYTSHGPITKSARSRINTGVRDYYAYTNKAKAFGRLGTALTVLSVASDLYSYSVGDISGERFAYHIIGTGVSVGSALATGAAVGTAFGGPVGTVAGAIVGGLVSGSFIFAEYLYDNE